MFNNLVLKGTVGKLLTCRLQICNKIFLPHLLAHCVKKMFNNLVLKGTVGKLLTCRLQICNKIFLPHQLVHCILIYIRIPDNSQQAGCMSCYTLSVLLHTACFYYTLPVSITPCLCLLYTAYAGSVSYNMGLRITEIMRWESYNKR